jgi:hypothetical protein
MTSVHIIEEDRNPLCCEAKVTRTSLMNKLKNVTQSLGTVALALYHGYQ